MRKKKVLRYCLRKNINKKLMPYTGVLSDEAIKKSCAAFFVQNPIVAEELDPQTIYKPNEFLTGFVKLPTVKRKKPKRAYDDLATFLSLSGQKSKIQEGVDEFNRQALLAYENNGSGVATSASMQLPFEVEEDPQLVAENTWAQYTMLSTTIGALALGSTALNFMQQTVGGGGRPNMQGEVVVPEGEEMV